MAIIQPISHIPGGRLAEWVERADFAVLPLGAVEWHGPHLPFGTDLILSDGFASRIPGDHTAVLYPTLAYTACPGKTMGYAGTISVRPEVALSYLCDVLSGILRAGFDRVLLLNAHDANMALARAAMEYVTGQHKASLLLVNWFQLVTPQETADQGMFTGHSGRGHGGPYETAVTWAFAPDGVELEKAPELQPRPALATDRPYVLVESRPSPWDGYSGLIKQATREKGQAIADQALVHLDRLLKTWVEAPLPDEPPGNLTR